MSCIRLENLPTKDQAFQTKASLQPPKSFTESKGYACVVSLIAVFNYDTFKLLESLLQYEADVACHNMLFI